MKYLIFIPNNYAKNLFIVSRDSGFFGEEEVILLHRDIALVSDLADKKFEIPMLQYFELDSWIKKIRARKQADNIVRQIVGKEEFRLLVPHHDCVMFHRLKENRDCTGYWYMEEGTASLLDEGGTAYNTRFCSPSLVLEKWLGLKDNFRFFNVAHKNFRGHIGFFKPVALFGDCYVQIPMPKPKIMPRTQIDALLFLDKTMTGYYTDTAKEMDRVLETIGRLYRVEKIAVKPHPKTDEEGQSLLLDIFNHQKVLPGVDIELLNPKIMLEEIFSDRAYNWIISGYSSSAIELTMYTKKLTILLSKTELQRYYGDKWQKFILQMEEFQQRNSVEGLDMQVEIF